ncbi:MAG: hypothetical protein PWP60_1018 [Candidatus Atribacteria bacterium]|uniref:Clostripain-related cysteine peptidase n=1 Tax=Thermatribacter velox TaxID=3039681 RepID=A0ABZ2YEN4_9BACT|nr:hypothetical protein [Candidatus Atribacteria bacterium]
MKKRFLFLVVVLSIVFLISGCLNVGIIPTSGGSKSIQWTVMVFLNGDNDLEQAAWADLASMESVGSSNRVKVVVQFDQARGGTARYLVNQGGSTLLENLGEANMGDGNTLVDFVRFCAENYPAEHYALIIWNHGYGFKGNSKDISFDETSGGDALTIPELASALRQAKIYTGGKIDLLGMDACLMALVEVAYELRDGAQLLVASQESEPLEGWNYPVFLQALNSNPSMSASNLARSIVDSYISSYWVQSITLSAVDLTKVSALAQAVDELASAILSDSLTPPFIYLALGDSAQYFDDYDYVDLAHLALLLSGDPRIGNSIVKSAASQVYNLVQDTVLYSRTSGSGVSNAYGLSIYFPYKQYLSKYESLAFARSTQWDECLRFLMSYR